MQENIKQVPTNNKKMTVFIKLERDEINDIKQRIKTVQNSLLNLNSSAVLARKDNKEKIGLIQRGNLLINEAHEELSTLVGFMPQVDEFSVMRLQSLPSHDFKIRPIGREINKDEALRKLKSRISELK
jgi:hypothetical protein